VDWQTGRQLAQRLVPVNDEVIEWARRLPGPVVVA